jgi:outer membrane protein OmpA-like peptidoglycan-associated protein
MRQICFLLIGLLCATAPALAQVTVDLHALDALPGAKPAPQEPPAAKAAPKPAQKRLAVTRPAKPPPQQATATPAPASPGGTPAPAAPAPAPTAPAPPAATLPTAPPADVALAPIPPPPQTTPAPPPPAPPISDAATSAATATNNGLRVTFGTGEADLSPASASAIHGLVEATPAGNNTSYNVVAYAAGTPEDPSTARRLSLSRALAVRSALMADGISSSRIYVRALGATEGDETPDRVDVAVLGSNTATSASASAPPPAAAKSQQQ